MVGRDHKIYFYLGRIFEHQLLYEKMYFYKSGAVCGDVSETRKSVVRLECGFQMYYIQVVLVVCFFLAAFRIVQRWWIELQVVRAKEKGGEESCQS